MTNWRASVDRTTALTGAAYLAAAVLTIAFTRFEGGVACLWVASAVLTAVLVASPRERWPGLILACAGASMAATVSVGIGAAAAAPLAAINLAEAVIGALMLERLGLKRSSLDSLERLARIVVAVGIVAPAIAAPAGAGVVAFATGTRFLDNAVNWYTGHALGAVAVVPVASLVATGEAAQWLRTASRERLAESAALIGLVIAVTAAVFAQSSLPVLFLPILPMILATFRVGRLGAAVSVVIIAAIGGWLSARGMGPVALVDAGVIGRAQFFQFYLASTVLTALPVAAELNRRRALFNQLRESEARYRLLADNSSDIVMSLRADGVIRYASPSIAQLGGFPHESVVGRNAVELVPSRHRAAVTRAHLAALARPDETIIVEHRALTAGGEERWFETRTRGVRDESGEVSSVVSAIRDITHRKAIEGELSRAAATDPLTGLANRRAFDAALDRQLGRGGAACVAILDLDFFKRVNDRHGHEAGDRVLGAFAEVARGIVREGDTVARLGGEEFGVLLPGADLAQARLVCERIRERIAATPVPVRDGAVSVTASVGLAAVTPGMTRADVVRAADEALYRAKAEGRDRLRLAA